MSIFNNNITNDLSRTEKIRCWFRDRILEQFTEYGPVYGSVSERWKIFADDYHIIDLIHRDFVNMWTGQYHNELVGMGVFSTRTDVKKKIGRNKFRVIIHFSLSPDDHGVMLDDYEEVEVKDLKIDINEHLYEHIR